jgi:hypothetical protein
MLTNRRAQHTGPGINHPVPLFRRENQSHQRDEKIHWRLGYQGATPSCWGGRPPEVSGGIVSHNWRKEFNILADAPQQLVLEIRDTQKQPDL